ncbi:MAG: hypothetical protein A2315_02735 [Ignavibacteria bacterium RIFOXYB2_FULL_35_12]|nr:MAG: hypothetical protein A2058_06555 [Ignavibacteria bacterium GWA2_36_19]OGU50195.1 MAG: hypothetical protein A2006_06785 [Ignavibacteria bacterium GWC2_35_8]OGU56197.1 MAG: hypothetical protein A2X60_06800 [Ignavibacteria bacterium GWF2_35_20]OGU83393.1 MAG: hypothetical protein A2254_13970 [Ignavibacteria bacterium RIFOXYA2_FULL_35_9]OGU86709.1 MAG: hypothetical protein A2492_02850 [Ignavibacteria bacterium RIFOXYC12_FULL_35_11]OGU89404.1 MAG: hypothetical protein A3K31_14590 [Ignavibac
MKKVVILFAAIMSLNSYAQFKESGIPTTNIRDGIVNHSVGSLFGFLNSDNFTMRHSFNMSYSAFGNQGLALGVYTNSMMLKLAEDMNFQVDASIVQSPYSTFGKDFQNQMSGFYITRAAFNYKPWDDVFISIQYRNLPLSYHYSDYGFYNNRFYNPFFSDGFFER